MQPPDAPDSTSSRDLLLFLCVANVCRSPAMAFLVEQNLKERGLGTSWKFTSAGTAVTERQQMCAGSAAHIASLPGGDEFARTHRSRPLDRDLVERAGLILVASQHERSVVARLMPSARGRTFTIIEAALLAEKAASRVKVSTPDATHDGPAALGTLVSAIDRSRGLLPQETSMPRHGIFAPKRGPGDFDIRDVHSGGARKRHHPVLEDLTWASSHFTEAFARIAGAQT